MQSAVGRLDKINKLLTDNKLFGEAWEESNGVIAVQIYWGDWKHEHARLDWLVRENVPGLKKAVTEVTEDDGSDCYSGIHRFYFKEAVSDDVA